MGFCLGAVGGAVLHREAFWLGLLGLAFSALVDFVRRGKLASVLPDRIPYYRQTLCIDLGHAPI